jgi:hypothetical protein
MKGTINLMAEFQTLVTKVLSDETFRKALLTNPETTLRMAGIEPTAEMLEVFEGATEESLTELANNFSEDQAAL